MKTIKWGKWLIERKIHQIIEQPGRVNLTEENLTMDVIAQRNLSTTHPVVKLRKVLPFGGYPFASFLPLTMLQLEGRRGRRTKTSRRN